MSFCQVQWFSSVLRKQVEMNVVLPDSGEPPFPVYYLLHGLSDDHTIWHRRTRIEWYVRELPLIVVMPDGDRGFYTNHEQGPDYAAFMGEELPAFVERTFPASAAARGRCIGGLSMGGYGALRVGLAYADRYASVNSHSGAVMIGSGPIETDKLDGWEPRGIFGDDPSGSDHDLVALAARAKARACLPKIRLDCGTEDFLLDSNRHFHTRLEAMEVGHEYEEFPGAHSWDYWDVHVQDALAFHCRCLGITAPEAGQ